MRRTDLLELVERELPRQSVRYSSKIVNIEESGYFKLVHLADGSVYRAKVREIDFVHSTQFVNCLNTKIKIRHCWDVME